jgi:hypothetical protein
MSTTQYPGRPRAPTEDTNERVHRRLIAQRLNDAIGGRLDVTLGVTLDANKASTTVTDSRISFSTAPLLIPTTAHAAAEVAAGGLYCTPTAGQLVIHHANNAQTDRSFQLALVG